MCFLCHPHTFTLYVFFEEAARSLFSGFTHNTRLTCCLTNARFSLYAKSKQNTLRVSPRKRLNVGSGLRLLPRAPSAAAAGAVGGGDPSWPRPAGAAPHEPVRARSPAPAGRERGAAAAAALPSLLNAATHRAAPASSAAPRTPRRPRSAPARPLLPPAAPSSRRPRHPSLHFSPPSAGRTSASLPTAPRPGPSLSPLGAPPGPPGRPAARRGRWGAGASSVSVLLAPPSPGTGRAPVPGAPGGLRGALGCRGQRRRKVGRGGSGRPPASAASPQLRPRSSRPSALRGPAPGGGAGPGGAGDRRAVDPASALRPQRPWRTRGLGQVAQDYSVLSIWGLVPEVPFRLGALGGLRGGGRS